MRRLAVIPSVSIEAHKRKGTASWVKDYYNPLHFFDEAYLLSPLEKDQRYEFGMQVVPTKPAQLKERLRELKIDMVRAYGGYRACDMACYNKVNGVPVTVSVHDTNPEILHPSIKYADYVICMSKAVVELVKSRNVPEERIFILPNRVNLNIFTNLNSPFKSELDNKYKAKYKILHVGRKVEQKNLDTVIKALHLLGEEYICIFVGRGDTGTYINLAKQTGVFNRCYFIDSIPNHELPKYYSWCDCMCTPSRSEGFGLVFIEALACQAVVVTSDIPPLNEYIQDDFNGILVKEYENTQILAENIRKACTNQNLRIKLKSNARNSVLKFSKDLVDKQEVNIYKTILDMRDSGNFSQIKTPRINIIVETSNIFLNNKRKQMLHILKRIKSRLKK